MTDQTIDPFNGDILKTFPTLSDAELSFGGIRNSGYGREPGDVGVQVFINKRLVRTAEVGAPV